MSELNKTLILDQCWNISTTSRVGFKGREPGPKSILRTNFILRTDARMITIADWWPHVGHIMGQGESLPWHVGQGSGSHDGKEGKGISGSVGEGWAMILPTSCDQSSVNLVSNIALNCFGNRILWSVCSSLLVYNATMNRTCSFQTIYCIWTQFSQMSSFNLKWDI